MELKYLNLEDIHLEPEFERRRRPVGESPASDEFLMGSLAEVGMVEPLLVKEASGKYLLTDGYRRYRKLVDLHRINKLHESTNLSAVPCLVFGAEEVSASEIRVGSFERQNLSPSQEAHFYRLLSSKYGVSRRELARMMGISQMSIGNYLVVAECVPQVQKAIDRRTFPISAGKLFAPLTPDGQRQLFKRVEGLERVRRQDLINAQKALSDSAFKRPFRERMKISAKVRSAKKGQIQEKPLVREVLDTSLSDTQSELEELDSRIQDVRLVIDRIGTWWARVLATPKLPDLVQEREPGLLDFVLPVLQEEGFEIEAYA